MAALSVFCGSLVAALAAAGLIVLLLWNPLSVLLSDLCGGDQRGRFWTLFSSIVIALVTTIGVLLVPPGTDVASTLTDSARIFLPPFRAGLIALLVAVLLIGGSVVATIMVQQRHQPRQ